MDRPKDNGQGARAFVPIAPKPTPYISPDQQFPAFTPTIYRQGEDTPAATGATGATHFLPPSVFVNQTSWNQPIAKPVAKPVAEPTAKPTARRIAKPKSKKMAGGKKSGRTLMREEGLERTDNGLKQTSWPEAFPINQKNYYTYVFYFFAPSSYRAHFSTNFDLSLSLTHNPQRVWQTRRSIACVTSTK